MTASLPKGWRVDYAKSGRAACKSCNNLIAQDSLRIARVVQSTKFDGFMTVWHHSKCILRKPGRIKSSNDVEGMDDLRWEDNRMLQKFIEAGDSENVSSKDDDAEISKAEVAIEDCVVENSKSSRATCRSCNEKIRQGQVRVSVLTRVESGHFRGRVSAWRHFKCFMDLGQWVRPLELLPGWQTLTSEDQETLLLVALASGMNSKPDVKGSKRKVVVLEDSATVVKEGSSVKKKGSNELSAPAEKKSKVSLEKRQDKLSHASSDNARELQSKEFWALKDELKKHVTTAELRILLASNSMDVSGTQQALRDRCADGMMFGALAKCPMCGSQMEYQHGQYTCKGFVTAWSKCAYTTLLPERIGGRFKIPSDIGNDFLIQWNGNQKADKVGRLLLPSSPTQTVVKPAADTQSRKLLSSTSLGGPFGGLSIAVVGKLSMTKGKLRKMIEESGGSLSSVAEDTYCVVTNQSDITRHKDKLQYAQSLNVPIVKEEYLLDCIEKKAKLPIKGYTVEMGLEPPTMLKVKVKGRSAVHEDSGLQDTGHILEVGKVIYNVTLSLSDMSAGLNSFYILQIIEDDHKKLHHLFRKWGRVGQSNICGQKIEKLGKSQAIVMFRRLFQEKTGNSWEAWENHEDLQKQPGKFYVLDVDFGVNNEAPMRALVPAGSKSKLDHRIVNLMKLLFDIETYRSALVEFEINVGEMPLGKLSTRRIEQGFHVLTEIQNLMNSNSPQQEGQLVDASNRFFTLIPSVQPKVICSVEMLKSKIDMLEALRDIEIASQLIESAGASDEDPIDIHYGKLHCDISPLPKDSDDYNLVKKYLERTHAPTHREWELELEDVFVVEREGEYDAFRSHKGLENRMLLWHGSRTTNYVGILSQGLRIAPPEAPVTGYMFGKGLYFADLVSKSAQYCYTSKKNPTGLLLLCEVALGKSKKFTSAKYMEKPRNGTNSTKGVGKMIPLQSEFELLNDNVIVPCGRPVPSGSSDSDLLYNEYIVYDTAQVHLKFLLKVNFKHKR